MKIQHNIYHPIIRFRRIRKHHLIIMDVSRETGYIFWLLNQQKTNSKQAIINYFYEMYKG